jgi:mono/diheme cytochrome c family protein
MPLTFEFSLSATLLRNEDELKMAGNSSQSAVNSPEDTVQRGQNVVDGNFTGAHDRAHPRPQIPASRTSPMRVGFVVVLVVACLSAARATSAQSQQVTRGTTVYADQKCAVCHSIGGKGNAKGPLDDVGKRLTADEIRTWIVDPATMTKKTNAARKPPMRAYPDLSKEDLDALTAYMLSLKK